MNTNSNYIVTLTNDSQPFADDSAYDVELVTIFKKEFEDKKEAKKFFKDFSKRNDMKVFYNEASGNGKILSCNF